MSCLLSGDEASAASKFESVNNDKIRDYIEFLWGSGRKYPEQAHYFRLREVRGLVHPEQKVPDRMPGKAVIREMIERDGYRCRYCGLPVIPADVRIAWQIGAICSAMGAKNVDQHAAFQALWMQIEHVLPHALGGDNTLSNLVVSCAGCNFGKGNRHLDELGLIHPLDRQPIKSAWNGLTHYLDFLED